MDLRKKRITTYKRKIDKRLEEYRKYKELADGRLKSADGYAKKLLYEEQFIY